MGSLHLKCMCAACECLCKLFVVIFVILLELNKTGQVYITL